MIFYEPLKIKKKNFNKNFKLIKSLITAIFLILHFQSYARQLLDMQLSICRARNFLYSRKVLISAVEIFRLGLLRKNLCLSYGFFLSQSRTTDQIKNTRKLFACFILLAMSRNMDLLIIASSFIFDYLESARERLRLFSLSGQLFFS